MNKNFLMKLISGFLALVLVIAALAAATTPAASAYAVASTTPTVTASAQSQATVTVNAPVPPAKPVPCPTDGEMQVKFGFDKVGIKPVNTSVLSEGENCKWTLQAVGVYVFRGIPFLKDWQFTVTLADAMQTVAVFYGDGVTRDTYGLTFRYMPSYAPDHWVWDADRLMAHEFNFGSGQGRNPRYATINGNLNAPQWNGYMGNICPANTYQVAGLVGGEPNYWKAPDWSGGAWVFAVSRDANNKPTSFLRLTAAEVIGMDTWVDFYNTQAGKADSLVKWQNMPLADASYHCHPTGTSAEHPANQNGTNLVPVPPAMATSAPVIQAVTEVVVSTPTQAPSNTAAPQMTSTSVPVTNTQAGSTVTAVVIGTLTSTPVPSRTPEPTATQPENQDGDDFFGSADHCPLVRGVAPDGCPPAPTATMAATQPGSDGSSNTDNGNLFVNFLKMVLGSPALIIAAIFILIVVIFVAGAAFAIKEVTDTVETVASAVHKMLDFITPWPGFISGLPSWTGDKWTRFSDWMRGIRLPRMPRPVAPVLPGRRVGCGCLGCLGGCTGWLFLFGLIIVAIVASVVVFPFGLAGWLLPVAFWWLFLRRRSTTPVVVVTPVTPSPATPPAP